MALVMSAEHAAGGLTSYRSRHRRRRRVANYANRFGWHSGSVYVRDLFARTLNPGKFMTSS